MGKIAIASPEGSNAVIEAGLVELLFQKVQDMLGLSETVQDWATVEDMLAESISDLFYYIIIEDDHFMHYELIE